MITLFNFNVLSSGTISNQNKLRSQGSKITIKLPYVITYVCQNFGIRDARRQMPKNKC